MKSAIPSLNFTKSGNEVALQFWDRVGVDTKVASKCCTLMWDWDSKQIPGFLPNKVTDLDNKAQRNENMRIWS